MRNLAAQTQLQSASIDRLESMSRAQANLITTLTERVSMRSGLLERAAGRKSDALDATQALREEEATVSSMQEFGTSQITVSVQNLSHLSREDRGYRAATGSSRVSVEEQPE